MFFKKKEQDNRYENYENSHLDIKLSNLQSKYETMKQSKEYFEKEYKKMKGITETLCKTIVSNEYNLKQLGGKNILNEMDIYNLVDFAKMDYQKQKINYLNQLKILNDQIKTQQIAIDTLKKQLTQTMLQNNQDISMEEAEQANVINNVEHEVQSPIIAKIEKDNLGNIKNVKTEKFPSENNNSNKKTNSPLINFSNKQEITEKESSSMLTIENVDSYMAAMTDIMWDIMEAIGTEGYAESNDILDWIEKKGTKYTKSNILNSITSLKKMNVLNAENISTGYRRFQIFKFSQKGIEMFKAYFKKEPIESEIDKIKRDHDNVLHGYTIKDAQNLLLEYHGCKSATMDRKEVSIKLPDGKTYIPDIVATKENGEKMYVEVELGNTPQKDFNNKLKKMLQVTKKLYFVTDVEDTLKKKLEGQVSMGVLHIGGKEKVSGVTIYLTTMTQLSKGDFSKTISY